MENDTLLEPGRYDQILNASDGINHKITQITVHIEGVKGPVWVEPLEDQTLEVSVQTPDTPSNGNSSPNVLVVILGIVRIVGAVGLGASIVGLLFIRSRRSELDKN